MALLLVFAACGDDEDVDVVDGATEESGADTNATDTTQTPTARDDDKGAQALKATLAPLNRSGANGTATAAMKDGQLAVTVTANGVSPTLPHAQHIHIGGRNECPDADAGNASEPKDLIDTAEGQPAYGPVKVSLTTEGGVGEDDALAVPRFPTADARGNYTYTRTFDLPPGTTADDVKNGVVVVHGISKLFADQAKYDGAPKSSLNPSLPLEATIPALCGRLQ
ncbi:MAG: hypothetical protein KY439_04390 [Actinobacteria bacterium]|nr:hypothetical protein [Actinomycetota bacterium]